MTSTRFLAALTAAAVLLLPAVASARLPDPPIGMHHRITTADLDRPAPPAAHQSAHDGFPWLETAGVAGLVVVAGAGTARRRRRAAAIT
jgi:hypothetical protein